MLVNDTIAAIATGMGNAGVGIIRISGKNAVEVASKVFRPANKEKKIESMKSYTAAFGQVYDGDKELDEGILLLMRAPHTYTCEDVCELQCHGGMVVLRNVLAAVIKNGARLAEPGEFTVLLLYIFLLLLSVGALTHKIHILMHISCSSLISSI